MAASSNVFSNVFEYVVDSDVFGNTFEWSDITIVSLSEQATDFYTSIFVSQVYGMFH
jgi:hypothetical protein